MIKRIKITPENIHDFEIGTRVLFDYGPMCSIQDGIVVDYGTSQFCEAYLVAVDEDDEEHQITQFVNKGIGVYLLADNGRPIQDF